jgi:hypothetical protein
MLMKLTPENQKRHFYLPWMSASALSAGLACLMAFARSTKSCSREEGGTPVARLEGDPPEGGPLVSGTVGENYTDILTY